jgi:hypothetical protein
VVEAHAKWLDQDYYHGERQGGSRDLRILAVTDGILLCNLLPGWLDVLTVLEDAEDKLEYGIVSFNSSSFRRHDELLLAIVLKYNDVC